MMISYDDITFCLCFAAFLTFLLDRLIIFAVFFYFFYFWSLFQRFSRFSISSLLEYLPTGGRREALPSRRSKIVFLNIFYFVTALCVSADFPFIPRGFPLHSNNLHDAMGSLDITDRL